ncbi:hypothetical protein PAMP_011713 [Pampus punctatissimus]
MGCCSVTQRHTGVDEVGPDEIELLVLSGDNLGFHTVRTSCKVMLWGRSREELQHRLYSQRPIQGWESPQHPHMYGEIIHSSLVSLQNSYTRETTEHFLVLFTSHLLILSLDHDQQDFVYEGILPLSGLSFRDVSVAADTSHSPHKFEISMWQWEGSPIQHMGQPEYISTVHIINTLRQGLQERLMVLFPQDVLLLSVDNKRLNIRYEGRMARQSIKAVERSPERLEFELIGELVDPLQVSCSYLEDYQNWLFQLQQPDRSSRVTVSRAAPPIMPKLKRSQKDSQEPKITDHRFDINRRS